MWVYLFKIQVSNTFELTMSKCVADTEIGTHSKIWNCTSKPCLKYLKHSVFETFEYCSRALIAIASHQRDYLSKFRFVIEIHCWYHPIEFKRNMIFASWDYFCRMNMTQHRFSVKNMHVTCNIIPTFEKKVEGLWTK